MGLDRDTPKRMHPFSPQNTKAYQPGHHVGGSLIGQTPAIRAMKGHNGRWPALYISLREVSRRSPREL